MSWISCMASPLTNPTARAWLAKLPLMRNWMAWSSGYLAKAAEQTAGQTDWTLCILMGQYKVSVSQNQGRSTGQQSQNLSPSLSRFQTLLYWKFCTISPSLCFSLNSPNLKMRRFCFSAVGGLGGCYSGMTRISSISGADRAFLSYLGLKVSMKFSRVFIFSRYLNFFLEDKVSLMSSSVKEEQFVDKWPLLWAMRLMSSRFLSLRELMTISPAQFSHSRRSQLVLARRSIWSSISHRKHQRSSRQGRLGHQVQKGVSSFMKLIISWQELASGSSFLIMPSNFSKIFLFERRPYKQISQPMGQHNCCGEQQRKFNKQFSSVKGHQGARQRPIISVETVESFLSSAALKARRDLPVFQFSSNFNSYEGFRRDEFEEVQAPSGFYLGEWKNNEFHGKGQFFFKDGSYYEGTFYEGKAEGEGRYIFNNGCVYEGGIRNNDAHGLGSYHDPFQGYYYDGEWAKDIPSGRGKEKFSNGCYYEGEFLNGVKEGIGRYVSNSGIYEGEFKNGKFDGRGTFTYVDNRRYTGDWKNGVIEGKGVFSWPNGNRYEGEYRKGLKHGKGVFYFAEGKVFKGSWEDGKKHGFGQLQMDGEIIKGLWRNGELEHANQ